MTREIKFRAWWKAAIQEDGDRKMWAWEELEQFRMYDLEHLDEWVFMQYTGLKDKNGVEIYEGDILKLYDGDCFEVVYRSDIAAFALKDNYAEYNLAEYISDYDGEVIGNIYENPELLK